MKKKTAVELDNWKKRPKLLPLSIWQYYHLDEKMKVLERKDGTFFFELLSSGSVWLLERILSYEWKVGIFGAIGNYSVENKNEYFKAVFGKETNFKM